MSRFSLAKSRVGAYFNDGRTTVWYQAVPSDGKCPDQKMVLAVRAACKEFDRVYWKERKR